MNETESKTLIQAYKSLLYMDNVVQLILFDENKSTLKEIYNELCLSEPNQEKIMFQCKNNTLGITLSFLEGLIEMLDSNLSDKMDAAEKYIIAKAKKDFKNMSLDDKIGFISEYNRLSCLNIAEYKGILSLLNHKNYKSYFTNEE
jgi:hypothetical protein